MKDEVRSANRRARCASVALAGFLLLAVPPSDANAQWGGEMRTQMGFGGDQLANVEYSDGSESDLSLGKYFSVTLGPVYEAWSSGPNSIELQGMAGYAGWSTGPANTDDRVGLHRIPIDLLAFYAYRMPNEAILRFGGGLTYHLVGGVGGSGRLEGFELEVGNGFGATGEVSAVLGLLSVGLRYTSMSNSLEGLPVSLDGSSIGLFVGLTTLRN